MFLLQEVLELEEEPDRAVDPIEDLGMDSIDIVDYVLRIEEKFGYNIDEFDTRSQHMRTVGEMIGYLAQFLENGEGTNDG